MLPAELLVTTRRGAVSAPRYLTARDEVWIRRVLDRSDAFVGKTVGERDDELPREIVEIAAAQGASRRAALGVLRVVTKRHRAEIASPVPVTELRRVVFEEAARDVELDRPGALARAAARLGVTVADVELALFSDRARERRVVAPAAPLSPDGVLEAYNLSLVQGLLLRSEHVVVDVAEHARAVVRFAKLSGLLCVCAARAEGTRLELSGPLSILRHTTKYGFALASFVPAAAATPGFRLVARCQLRDDLVFVEVTSADRLARAHALPRDADSAAERALARDLRRLETGFTFAREAHAIHLGELGEADSRLFFPDFSLRRGDDVVLVEIVGFYTAEYLANKLASLQAAARRHAIVVCVDASLDVDMSSLPAEVVPFRKRVDAALLIAAAERALGRRATPP